MLSKVGGGWDSAIDAMRAVDHFCCPWRVTKVHVAISSVVSIRTSRCGKGRIDAQMLLQLSTRWVTSASGLGLHVGAPNVGHSNARDLSDPLRASEGRCSVSGGCLYRASALLTRIQEIADLRVSG